MRLAFTSDIHVDINGSSVMDALAARVRELSPDVLLLAGDIATGARTFLGTLLTLKPLVPHLLVCAGNHDIWSGKEAVAKGIDAWTWLDTLLPALCKEAGAHYLDGGPIRIGNTGFAGSLGWYDLTMREHTLDAPPEAYTTGRWGGLKWNDFEYAIWKGEDGAPMAYPEVAERLRTRLAGHMAQLDAPRLVVATHVLAFEQQIHRKEHPGWRFVNAFMGSLPLGQLIRSDPRVVLHIAGHTHRGSDLRIGRLRAVVSPLGYKGEWKASTPAEAVAKALTVIELAD
jgi:hypothetical protein